ARYLFQHGHPESWDQIFYIVPIFFIGLFETTFGAATIPLWFFKVSFHCSQRWRLPGLWLVVQVNRSWDL
ncbi:MAG TPA: hypothetical protein VKZ68_05790, partial [Ohtaekwangia sp.]|nr:hypothetical protein [Ohtaekwangia sp.]